VFKEGLQFLHTLVVGFFVQQQVTYLVIVVCVRAAGLDETVKGILAFQRHLLTLYPVDQLLCATIHQFEG
jgi:hypothetical protein